MQELGVQMIAAYSPQARGRSERSFGTWQGRLPQELRLAGITTAEGANSFLRERYIGEFNAQFSVPAAEKGTAFRRTSRTDLNWIFTVQTKRVVDQDNTVAIRERSWQIDKTRFRHTLAGSTVTIHEHLDETVSIPEALMVVARFYAHESCGQCTPCRESTGWIYEMTRRIVVGRGRKADLDTILDVARRGAGTTICAFYDGAVGPYISYIEKFRAEFESLIPK